MKNFDFISFVSASWAYIDIPDQSSIGTQMSQQDK